MRERNGLHATGGDSAAHLVPEQRADLIADKTIENAPRLLRINDVLIDPAGFFDGRANRLRRDFIEEDAEDLGLVPVENFFQVLADRFAFTIRVSREKNAIGGLRCGAQFFNDLFFAGNDFVDRLEIVVDIDTELALGQILHVAERGFHDKVLAQIFVNRVCFCR